jgi:tRNA U34 2-thiouridine synthase MnmA/TrmU
MVIKHKVLLLFSGGLDSRIALKVLQEQKNLDIEMVYFKLPFGGGCCNSFNCVFNYSQTQKIKLHVINFAKSPLLKEYLEIIKSPKHGFGTAMNPCKDCKILMLKHAKILADKIKAKTIATGEVLGQRPMSQLKHQLELTEKQSNLKGRLLRPLSAKLLKTTLAEEKGIINRTKLLDIVGRSRKQQIELAKKYKIKYPNAGGGCLLCDKKYCKKLKELIKNTSLDKIKPEQIQLLNIGRHYKNPKTNKKIILGKNENENILLEQINKTLKQKIIIPTKIPGPTAIYEDKEDKELAKELINAYSKNAKLSLRKKFEKLRIK